MINSILVVDNLEKQGVVKRERNPQDRRQIIVSLTRSGKDLIRYVFPRHLDYFFTKP